jgi:plastocyanin
MGLNPSPGRHLKALVITGALVVLAACSGSTTKAATPPPPNAAVTVVLHNIAFNPQTVTIKAGQTVAWKFDDGTIVHNVTFNSFASNDLSSGYYTHTFTAPGTYRYVCTIHSNMTGVVIVTPAPATTAAP